MSRHYDDDDDLDISNIRRPPPQDDLSTGDWLLCIFCSGIACIVAIVRLAQGRPGAGKMLGVSLLFIVVWNILYALLQGMSRP
jgi:hypothetical protein